MICYALSHEWDGKRYSLVKEYRTVHSSPKARFPFKRNRLRCVNENRNKRKRLRWQAANHGCHCFDRAFLLAGACVCCVNASAYVSCGFRLRNARNASDCVWMETGLYSTTNRLLREGTSLSFTSAPVRQYPMQSGRSYVMMSIISTSGGQSVSIVVAATVNSLYRPNQRVTNVEMD